MSAETPRSNLQADELVDSKWEMQRDALPPKDQKEMAAQSVQQRRQELAIKHLGDLGASND